MSIKSGYEQLIWGNSIEDVKRYYPNLTERSSIGSHRVFDEMINNGIVSSRVFKLYEEKLYLVQVIFDEEQINSPIIDALYEDLLEKYGKFDIDEKGHYEGGDDFYEEVIFCKKRYASDFEITLFGYCLVRNSKILSDELEIVYKDPNVVIEDAIEDTEAEIITYAEWEKMVEARGKAFGQNGLLKQLTERILQKASEMEMPE